MPSRRPCPWCPRASSRPPPSPAVAGKDLVGLFGAPFAGPIEVWLLVGPELLERVDDPPGCLDLLALREQRRIPDEHVKDQPLVRLRRGLGEGLAVKEVHRDVADLHRAAGHLGTELQGDPLVRLDSYDELVVAQLLG